MKASEDQWAVRKKQIADDTQTTIDISRKALNEATKDAKGDLDGLWGQVKTARDELENVQKEQKAVLTRLGQSIATLEHKQKVLSRTNDTLRGDNRTLGSEIIVQQETVELFKTVEQGLSTNIADLRVQQQGVEDKLVDSRISFEYLTKEIEQLEGTIRTQTDQFNTDISILEKKKQVLAQEIVENRIRDDKVRENLASWSKQLDERDKNLRIRESRVNDQEKAIARNYNLLNL